MNPRKSDVDWSRTDRASCLGCITTGSLFSAWAYADLVIDWSDFRAVLTSGHMVTLLILLLPAIALAIAWWLEHRIATRAAKGTRSSPTDAE